MMNNIRLRNLLQEDADVLSVAQQLIIHKHPRRYAVLDIGDGFGTFLLTWCSDEIEPVLHVVQEENQLWIGIDERIAVVNLNTGYVELSIKVDSYFSEFFSYKDFMVVLCATGFIAFNYSCSIRSFAVLPDITSSCNFVDGKLAIEILDGQTLFFLV